MHKTEIGMTFRKTKRPPNPEAVLRRLASLCARSEQCSADIAMKLSRSGLPPAESRKIMQQLIDGKFIDDARYAKAFTSDKLRFSGWGRRRIQAYLAMKRIPSQMISEAMDDIDPVLYSETLRKVAKAKAAALDITDRDDRNKLLRHIVQRGFEIPAAMETIRELIRESKD